MASSSSRSPIEIRSSHDESSLPVQEWMHKRPCTMSNVASQFESHAKARVVAIMALNFLIHDIKLPEHSTAWTCPFPVCKDSFTDTRALMSHVPSCKYFCSDKVWCHTCGCYGSFMCLESQHDERSEDKMKTKVRKYLPSLFTRSRPASRASSSRSHLSSPTPIQSEGGPDKTLLNDCIKEHHEADPEAMCTPEMDGSSSPRELGGGLLADLPEHLARQLPERAPPELQHLRRHIPEDISEHIPGFGAADLSVNLPRSLPTVRQRLVSELAAGSVRNSAVEPTRLCTNFSNYSEQHRPQPIITDITSFANSPIEEIPMSGRTNDSEWPMISGTMSPPSPLAVDFDAPVFPSYETIPESPIDGEQDGWAVIKPSTTMPPPASGPRSNQLSSSLQASFNQAGLFSNAGASNPFAAVRRSPNSMGNLRIITRNQLEAADSITTDWLNCDSNIPLPQFDHPIITYQTTQPSYSSTTFNPSASTPVVNTLTPSPSNSPTSDRSEYQCPYCDHRPSGKPANFQVYLQKHIANAHRENKLRCPDCGKKIKRKDNLKTHQKNSCHKRPMLRMGRHFNLGERWQELRAGRGERLGN